MSATKTAPDSQTESQTESPINIPHTASQESAVEDECPPRRNSRWLDLPVVALMLIVLLGGIGNAFSEAGVLEAPVTLPAAGVEGCPEGGCVKPPEELCGGKPLKAVVGGDGQRLYYSADHPSYHGLMTIHIERGDRWFCTPAAAEANGFAPAP